MKAAKYLFALWATLVIYASLAAVFGAMGLFSQFQLEQERQSQEANVENLKKTNRELEGLISSLLYDEDTMVVYAREQGYASKDERFARIVGLKTSQRNKPSSGSVIFAAEPQFIPDRTFRIIALCVGISILFCSAMYDLLKFLRER
jgi:cell division protein FtsB